MTRIAELGARYVVFQHTAAPVALAIRNARELGLDFTFVCLNYSTNEILLDLAGEYA